MRKVLWTYDNADPAALIERANFVRAQAICIRTTVPWLSASLPSLKSQGFAIYGWRWPAVDNRETQGHYYADEEAKFAVSLIQNGLDGYIVDPESDTGRPVDDWNEPKLPNNSTDTLQTLAARFCDTIKLAGRRKNPNFLFGITSGCRYPTQNPRIPWAEFLAHSDAAFPQLYWAPNIRNRNTPAEAYAQGIESWRTVVPSGMRIIPIIGEIATVEAAEIASYSTLIQQNNIQEIHYYTYETGVPQQNWDALRALG
jgi:hypothetical protein